MALRSGKSYQCGSRRIETRTSSFRTFLNEALLTLLLSSLDSHLAPVLVPSDADAFHAAYSRLADFARGFRRPLFRTRVVGPEGGRVQLAEPGASPPQAGAGEVLPPRLLPPPHRPALPGPRAPPLLRPPNPRQESPPPPHLGRGGGPRRALLEARRRCGWRRRRSWWGRCVGSGRPASSSPRSCPASGTTPSASSSSTATGRARSAQPPSNAWIEEHLFYPSRRCYQLAIAVYRPR